MEKHSNPTSHLKSSQLHAFRSSTGFITFVVAYAVFVDQFLFAVVIPVAPFALHERIHIPKDKVQFWVALLLAVYGVACFLASPFWGWWTDRNQLRRIPWLLGLSALLGATILLWLAPNTGVSLLARALQGVSSTVIWTTGLAIIVDTVGEARIGEFMGYIGIALNLGTLVGPALGGVVYARAGYNAVFIMTLALIAVDVVLRLMMIERHVSETPQRRSWYGGRPDSEAFSDNIEVVHEKKACVTVTAVPPMGCSHTNIGERELSAEHPEVHGTVRDRVPPLLRLLCSGRFLTALWGILVLALIYSGLETVLPLATHKIFGWTSIGGGLVFLPFMVPALLGPLFGMLVDRIGPRWLATTAFVGMCPLLVLLRLIDHNSLSQKVLLCVLLFIIGLCISLALEPLLAEVTYLGGKQGAENQNVGQGKGAGAYAQAYALFNMSWSVGNVAGPLLAGLVIDAAGWRTVAWSFGLLAGVTVLPIAILCGKRLKV